MQTAGPASAYEDRQNQQTLIVDAPKVNEAFGDISARRVYRRRAPMPVAPMPVPVPMYSPFGFGMGYGPGFGFGFGMPFFGGGFIFQLMMLAFVVNFVSGLLGGGDYYEVIEDDDEDDDFSNDWRRRR